MKTRQPIIGYLTEQTWTDISSSKIVTRNSKWKLPRTTDISKMLKFSLKGKFQAMVEIKENVKFFFMTIRRGLLWRGLRRHYLTPARFSLILNGTDRVYRVEKDLAVRILEFIFRFEPYLRRVEQCPISSIITQLINSILITCWLLGS